VQYVTEMMMNFPHWGFFKMIMNFSPLGFFYFQLAGFCPPCLLKKVAGFL